MNNVYITIQNENTVIQPVVIEGIQLTRTFGGAPSVLKFSALKDDILKFNCGDLVKLIYNGETVFNGFLFEIMDSSKDIVSFTCYDQLRYLKNKRSYNLLKNKTATEIIKMIADDFNLKYSELTDTKHKIGVYVSDNQTLIDLIYWYIYTTEIDTKKLYELYDDNGLLTVKDIEDMKLNILIDGDTIQDYTYKRSINNDTYNSVVLVQNEKDTEDGKRKLFYKADKDSISQWGKLELTQTIEGYENGNKKASDLLEAKNRETTVLRVKRAFGDVRVRGGSSVVCKLKLNNKDVNKYMLVRKVTHKFNNNEHYMDLTLYGGSYIG